MHFIYFQLFQDYLIGDFFWFDLFLEARAEILKKIVGILVETMTPKGHFKINWPLGNSENKFLHYGPRLVNELKVEMFLALNQTAIDLIKRGFFHTT